LVSTLIAVYNSSGCVGRCDATCYDATEPACDCICGGANHGAGKQQAIDNIRARGETWISRARDDGWDFDRIQAGLPVTCTPLL
jgi:hypothetical protein